MKRNDLLISTVEQELILFTLPILRVLSKLNQPFKATSVLVPRSHR
jgi:hypothetical protein